jgi:hypothetical protein
MAAVSAPPSPSPPPQPTATPDGRRSSQSSVRASGERLSPSRKSGTINNLSAASADIPRISKIGDSATLVELLRLMKPSERLEMVNAPDKNGSTPIFHAVWPNHVEVLRVLLESGADPNHQNTRLNTALHLACEQGHVECIRLLISFGAKTNVQNSFKKNCFEVVEDDAKRKELLARAEEWTREYERRALASSGGLDIAVICRQLFDAVDADCDGFLSPDDVRALLTLPLQPFEATLDRESHEALTTPPAAVMSRIRASNRLHPALQLSDAECAAPPRVSDAQLRQFVTSVDAKGDGRIDFDEFCAAVKARIIAEEERGKKGRRGRSAKKGGGKGKGKAESKSPAAKGK